MIARLLLIILMLSSSCYANSGYIPVEKGKLFYQSFGEGDPIIVVHGGPGLDQSYLLPKMRELSKNHKVIFYDQRGSGKSLETPMNSQFISLQKFTEDLDDIRKYFGFKKVILIGHSWGGRIVMNYAIENPSHVSALIVLNSIPSSYEGEQAFMQELFKRTNPIKQQVSPLFNEDEFKKLNANQINELYRTLFSVYFYDVNNEKEFNIDIDEASAKSGFKVRDLMEKSSPLTPKSHFKNKLTKIKVPTLLMNCKQDLVPVWTAKQVHMLIPHSKLVVLDKCGHFPYIEQPEQFFMNINSWLNEVG